MPSTLMCSNGPWKPYPPVPRFGHGSPINDSLAPSVPPRTGRDSGSRPTDEIASRARSMVYIFFSITESIFSYEWEIFRETVPAPYFWFISTSIVLKRLRRLSNTFLSWSLTI